MFRMIDPRIALAIQPVQTQSPSQVLDIFQNTLNQAQNRRANEQSIQQQAALQPFREAILAQQAEQAPIQSQLLQQQAQAGQQQADVGIENRTMLAASEFGNTVKPVLESGNVEQALSMFQGHVEDLRAKGLPTQGAEQIIQQLQGGNIQGVSNAIDAVQQNARQRGLLGASQISVGQRDFETKVKLVEADPELTTPAAKAAAIDLGLEAKASTSAAERIAASPALTTAVAKSEAEIAGAKSEASEGGKLIQQRKHKPAITALVKLAEKEATERGDVLTDLSRMEAGLPGLKDAVSQLKELSALATSTFGGKVFDAAVKQTGFGSTKGSTARAKMKAIIANQTLPLLKETFGSAFTEAEGQRLEASFADPDATHEERLAQLDAFIDQKERSIRTKKAQTNQTFNFDAQGNLIE